MMPTYKSGATVLRDRSYQKFRDVETDLRSQLKSRMDKLTNQIIKKIPPTNDTIIKEVQKMRDDFFALRQNF